MTRNPQRANARTARPNEKPGSCKGNRVFLVYKNDFRDFLSLIRTVHAEHYAGCNTGSDNARNVRSHRVHQQEVGRVRLLTLYLRYTGCHWYGGYTCRSNERIDWRLGNRVHQFRDEDAAGCSEAECQNAEDNDLDRRPGDECLACCGSAYAGSQQDNEDIGKGVR